MSSPELSGAALGFVHERYLATLTTLRTDGTPHVVPVGFTYAQGVARVITNAASVKARNAASGGRAVLCQVEGARWLTLEGTAGVRDDAAAVSAAVHAYAGRYRFPRENPTRVVIEIEVDRVMASADLRAVPSSSRPAE